jgi:hypothetical protein
MIAIAFAYLLIGWLIGGLLLASKAFPSPLFAWHGHQVHVECVQIGWIVHFVFGVAYWIFPRVARSQRPRSSFVVLSIVLLNLGIVFSCGVFLRRFPPLLLPIGRSAEFLAFLSFFVHLFPRIKAFGKA